jgi:hypothetical protein
VRGLLTDDICSAGIVESTDSAAPPVSQTFREKRPGLLSDLETVIWDGQIMPVIRTNKIMKALIFTLHFSENMR